MELESYSPADTHVRRYPCLALVGQISDRSCLNRPDHQELCVDGGDTESDGDLVKPIATYLSTSPCKCARLWQAPRVNETASFFSHYYNLFQAIENAFSVISAALGGPKHQ
ncbi:hypothetical protein G5I_06281 [Acromyrmex echinatior]|uniref:Uncharacterized protein n=1 Tax=Acromyrmex echinatior TaxID=103372 RepID=F4WKL3_ACREC|nr:hypothetical protein G5I_06281 [Acromyrmex echinatior]